ncbi:MAG TPA: protein phosphatase CheZ [candidate division Zixibacteria bacterium]|nr:protein phosphatase CheZ [candidate division Zixibacteria bacterium]
MAGSDILQNKIKKEILELSASISEIVDGYKRLRNPLLESQQNVPIATRQLDKISEQTEAATQQMLDLVEQITQREQAVIEGLAVIKNKAATGKNDEIAPIVDDLTEKANTSCNDAYTIMDALQFQDITSQQISHAMSLLEELESKLSIILTDLHGPKPEEAPTKRKKRAFDPHADMYEKKTEQSDIDNLFSQK